MELIKFQKIRTVYRLRKSENDFIKKIPLVYKKAWDSDFKDLILAGTLPADAKTQRDKIKKRIKDKLLLIQGPYCIYCGIHFDIVGTAQREHIVNKDKYPQFTYTNQNLALACAYCNGFEKKSSKNTIVTLDIKYKNCTFSIVHPYFDDIKKEIEFTFDGTNIFLSPKKNSVIGKNTIQIFKLMEFAQAGLRGAAYIRQKELARLKKKAIVKRNAVIIKKYSF